MDFLTALDLSVLTQAGIIILFVLYLIWDIGKRLLTKSELKKAKEKELSENKEKNAILKSLNDNLEKQSNINQKVASYLKTIKQQYTDELSDDQYRIFTHRLVSSAKLHIKELSKDIIQKNHLLGNKDVILNKLILLITNLFDKDEIDLKQFKYKDNYVNTFMDRNWISNLAIGINNTIFDNQSNEDKCKQMKFFIDNKFQIIYNSFLNKIK